MSKEEDIQAQMRALIEQYVVLQNYAESLQRDLNTVIGVLSEIRLAKETISSLKDEERNEFEVLISLDRGGNAYIKAPVIKPEKVIVNVGAGYYASLDYDKAIEVLTQRETELAKVIQSIQGELSKVAQYMEAIRAKLGELRVKKGN